MKRTLLPALLVVGGVLATAVAADQDGSYAGPDVCLRCHLDFAKRWASVTHSKELLKPGRPPAATGCEACHGPGADHALGNRKKIVAWPGLDQDERTAVCLKCHQGKVEAEPWSNTAHSLVLSCDKCHEVHRPVEQDWLLRQPQVKLCLACHDTLPQEIKAKTHHTLADDALTCDMCHNPHGSDNAHLLTMPQGELCEGCHGDDVPKGAEHDRKDWRLNHKDQAKHHEEQCYMCHSQESFCDQCHVIQTPHSDDFALKHKAEALKHPKACLSCHDKQEFCGLCHDPLPKPFDTMK